MSSNLPDRPGTCHSAIFRVITLLVVASVFEMLVKMSQDVKNACEAYITVRVAHVDIMWLRFSKTNMQRCIMKNLEFAVQFDSSQFMCTQSGTV